MFSEAWITKEDDLLLPIDFIRWCSSCGQWDLPLLVPCWYHKKTRLGWCKGVEFPHTKRPKNMPRGVFKMASATSDPGLVALGWMDNRPVYMLGSNVATELTTIQRREKNGTLTTVPCPQMVKAYQTYMGGVDKHDQLRLQSYSLQMANRFVKYYKSLFLGLVDMAIVNGYIIHNLVLKSRGEKEKDHLSYLVELQASLVCTAASDFTIETRHNLPSGLAGVSSHVLVQSAEVREHHGVRRFMQRACKVCSIYKVRTSVWNVSRSEVLTWVVG
jgi:hypothetical protein